MVSRFVFAGGCTVSDELQRFYVIERGDFYGERAQGPYSKAKARIIAEGTTKKIVTRAQLEQMQARRAQVKAEVSE